MNEQQIVDFSVIPTFLVGADNHNLAAEGSSWFSPANLLESITNTPKFAAVSALSGLNSFYNTGVAVANWFGADVEENDTSAWIASLDSDLGLYYDSVREGADLVGFMAGSLIPGILAVKGLRAGQAALKAAEAGMVGKNMSAATKLLIPNSQVWINLAKNEIAASQATFSTINANVLRGIRAGLGQAALESAAFEVAVAATMFKSPILEDMDIGDLAKNALIGVGLGSAIGGAFTAAKIRGEIKRFKIAADIAEKPYTWINEPPSSFSSGEKIVSYFEDLNNIPEVHPESPFFQKFTRLAENKKLKLENLILEETTKFVGGDKDLGTMLYQSLQGLDSEQIARNLLGANTAVRLSVRLPIEREVAKALREHGGEFVFHGTSKAAAAKIKEEGFALGSRYAVYLPDPANPDDLILLDQPTEYFAQKQVLSREYGPKQLAVRLKGKIHEYDAGGDSWYTAQQNAVPEAVKNNADILRLKNVKDPALTLPEEAKNVSDVYIVFNKAAIVDIADTKKELLQRFIQQYLKDTQKNLTYVKLWGDDAGKVFNIKPVTTRLADRTPEVQRLVDSYKFTPSKTQSILELDPDAIEARYIWARRQKLKEGIEIHEYDLPLLERAYELQLKNIKLIVSGPGEKQIFDVPTENLFPTIAGSKRELENIYKRGPHIRELEDKLAPLLLRQEREKAIPEHIAQTIHSLEKKLAKYRIDTDELARILNVKKSFLEGIENEILENDLLAYQHYQRQYTDQLVAKNLWRKDKGLYELDMKPSWSKIEIRENVLPDGHELEAAVYLKQKEKLLQEDMDRVLADLMGEFYDRFWRPGDELLRKSNSFGPGAGLFSFANGNYGSPEAWSEAIGAGTNAMRIAFRKKTQEVLEPILYRLSTNLDAALEYQAINELVAASPEKYVLRGDELVLRKLTDYLDGVTKNKPAIAEGIRETIPVKNPVTLEAIQAHIEMNGSRISGLKAIRAAQGLEDSKDPLTFYPIKPNPKEYRFFAFVRDKHAIDGNHVSMIHASDEKTLEQLINRVPSDRYQVITKAQSEEFHKALGDYDFERTLHENYIDVDLRSRGINSQFFPKTDPKKIADSVLQWHLTNEDVYARELVSAKFEKEFSILRKLGEQYTNIATSKYASNVQAAEQIVKNPYVNYIKTALDISKLNEYPLLIQINQWLDSAVSRAVSFTDEIFAKAKTPEELDLVNAKFEEYGLKTAYYDAATDLLANHSAPKGELSKFIRRANAILANLTLRFDPLNAINNAVGANVLLGAETKHVIRAIQQGNEQAIGNLAKLMNIQLPGVEDTIRSPAKLVGNAINRIFRNGIEETTQEFRKLGVDVDITLARQFKSILEDLTLRGDESVKNLNSRIVQAQEKARKLAEGAEKWTGNKWAEQFNRLIAADVMKQITDVAIEAGVMDARQQAAYIVTFINRTQGNILASQRPLIFQGPIGQAVGLFQTYQFNLMQQMFRYISEGTAKDAAMLLGLQGTAYGMNGLPAFNFINTYIVGTASGNPNHRDLYYATYGVFGENVANWLMYGIPSNLLQTNLYSRGDINPRHITIIPVTPIDVPIYGAYSRFFRNLKDTMQNVALGGNFWQSFVQGLEHNGLSRPLAGLAQTLQSFSTGKVISTSTKGNILGANDIFSVATLSRLAGGKPFDEARLLDAVYRYQYYASNDRAKRLKIVEAMKTEMIGAFPEQDVVENFAEQYVRAGGKQKYFNQQLMEWYKNANTSSINKLRDALGSPYSQAMQKLMGGEEFLDGRNL